jgi:magnesium transporter
MTDESIEYGETAGRLATAKVPTTSPHNIVGNVLAEVHSFVEKYQTIDYVYVLEDEKLVGVASLHELMSAKSNETMATIMETKLAVVHTNTDQEKIAQVALAQNIKAVPVVDKQDNFVGIISADVILRVLRDEHTDDVLKYAGIAVDTGQKVSEFTLRQHYISRIPWLILGLGGGVLAAWVVESFSHTIAEELALAAFIPAIVYIADAVGSQTQMVFVRTLGTKTSKSITSILSRELAIATAVGLTLAGLIATLSYSWIQSEAVTIILSSSVLATVYFSVAVAVLLPWSFHRAGYDPAVATGPLATVIRDVSSLLIYFLIALLVL